MAWSREYKRGGCRNEHGCHCAEINHLLRRLTTVQSDFSALQQALVCGTGLSAIKEAKKLRKLHPLKS